jgi:hypothetical protein
MKSFPWVAPWSIGISTNGLRYGNCRGRARQAILAMLATCNWSKDITHLAKSTCDQSVEETSALDVPGMRLGGFAMELGSGFQIHSVAGCDWCEKAY